MLDRRSFLGTLMASIAGTAFVQSPASLLWQPSALPDLPPVATGAILTLDRMTYAIVKAMGRMGASATFDPTPAAALGERGLIHQVGVDMEEYPELVGASGYDARDVDPIAAKLVEQMKHRQIRTMGELPLPYGVERACIIRSNKDGLCVRGLQEYDMAFQRNLLRFDFIGG
jgi:hypothetical protein